MRKIIPNVGRTVPMSDVTATAQRLEFIERQRSGSVTRARTRLADKLRVGVGTLENIIRNRVKTVDWRVKERLDALLIRELEAECARLQHELDMARQSGAHLASLQVGEIETHLARTSELLRGKTGLTTGGSHGEGEGDC